MKSTADNSHDKFVLHRLLKQLLSSLFKFKPTLTATTFGLITLKSITAGMTFLIILPLLDYVGLVQDTKKQSMHSVFSTLFDFFHLPKTLLTVLVLFSTVMCMTALLAYFEQFASTKLQECYHQYLRTYLQRSLLFSNWSFLRSQKKSDLIHILITETQHLAICNHQLLLLINQVFLISVNTLIAFYLSWIMTSFAIGTAALLFVFMFPLHRKTLIAGKQRLETNKELHEVISQQLSSIKTIKGSGFEVSSANAFEKTGHKLETLSTQFSLAVAANRLRYALCSAIIFSVLLYLAIQVLKLPFQQLVILLIIYARLLPLVSNAQQIYQRILHQAPAYQNIIQLLNSTQKHQETIHHAIDIPFHHQITLKNVSFKYPDTDRWIIRQANLQLKKNTSTLLLGPSGVGKTTLVDLISGLSPSEEGGIWIDDTLLTPHNAHAWRTQIAYITQDTFLFNATIKENLLWFSPEGTMPDLYYALELASAGFVYNLEKGLDTLIGESGITLSGGERQRIAVARAIIQKPKLLILDESTNSLDSERVMHIHQSLVALKGIMTILMISHQEVDLKMVDQVIKLEELDCKNRSVSDTQVTPCIQQ